MLFMGQTKKKTGWIWEYTIKINDSRFDGLLFLNLVRIWINCGNKLSCCVYKVITTTMRPRNSTQFKCSRILY